MSWWRIRMSNSGSTSLVSGGRFRDPAMARSRAVMAAGSAGSSCAARRTMASNRKPDLNAAGNISPTVAWDCVDVDGDLTHRPARAQ